jgi:hypothetical protein
MVVAGVCLLVGMIVVQGCALFAVGVVAGAAAGTVSYAGNELRTTQEVSLERAWDAANGTVKELQFTMVETRKDGLRGILRARNTQDQPIVIQTIRKSDRLTEIRVKVGTFHTSANRAGAQYTYDKIRARL